MWNCCRWRMLLLILLFYANTGRACSCTNITDNFLDAVRIVINTSYVDTEMAIVECRYLGNVGTYGTKFAILHSYYIGRFSLRDTVVVWGDPGWCCRFSPRGSYVPGDTLFAIVNSLQFQNVATGAESPGDYYIYGCNFNHLKVHRDSVYGGVVNSFMYGGYPKAAFLDSLNSIINAVNPPQSGGKPVIKIYPNPVGNELHLSLDGEPTSMYGVSVNSASGQLVYSGSMPGGSVGTIDVVYLPRGLYFVKVADSHQRIRNYKIVLQ